MPYKLVPEDNKSNYGIKEGASDVLRLASQATAGGLAALPGSFGNILKGVQDMIATPLYKARYGKGVSIAPYEETEFGKILPTTQQHLKTLEENIPYLKPKNKSEKFARTVVAEAVELLTPGKIFSMGQYALGPLRSLAISSAANTSGELTFQWTGSESKADMVKNGSMFLGSLFNRTSAKDVVKNLYGKEAALLPSGATVGTAQLNNNLNLLKTKILNGRTIKDVSPNEKFVIDEIGKALRNTSSGNIAVSTLQSIKRSLNDTLKNAVYEIKDPASRRGVKSWAKNIGKYIDETLESYGKQNPKWLKAYKDANLAHGAVEQSNFVSRGLEKFMKGRPEALAHLFGIGIPVGIGWFNPINGGLTLAGYQLTKLLTRVIKSKELKKHYTKVLGAAAADNPELAHKELDKFEEKLEKSKKNRYKLMD